MITFYGSNTTFIMTTFSHIICVISVVVTTVSADVTLFHKLPTKITIFFFYKKHPDTNKHYICSSKRITAIL